MENYKKGMLYRLLAELASEHDIGTPPSGNRKPQNKNDVLWYSYMCICDAMYGIDNDHEVSVDYICMEDTLRMILKTCKVIDGDPDWAHRRDNHIAPSVSSPESPKRRDERKANWETTKESFFAGLLIKD